MNQIVHPILLQSALATPLLVLVFAVVAVLLGRLSSLRTSVNIAIVGAIFAVLAFVPYTRATDLDETAWSHILAITTGALGVFLARRPRWNTAGAFIYLAVASMNAAYGIVATNLHHASMMQDHAMHGTEEAGEIGKVLRSTGGNDHSLHDMHEIPPQNDSAQESPKEESPEEESGHHHH